MKWFAGLMFCLIVGLTGCGQRPQPGSSLRIILQASYRGYLLPEGAFVPAPADIFIHPEIETTMAVHAGDTVAIDFFADGKKLCSAKAVWHDAGQPSNQPGAAQPMTMAQAGFMVPNCVWTNVPQGNRTVSIRAHDFHGLEASAGPMNFTVIAPLPHQPPRGAHVLTGKQRPPVKPELVGVFRSAPRGTFEVVGMVTVRAQVMQRQDMQAAVAELRKQAGLMGANCVVVDRASHSAGQPFSGPDKTFEVPEVLLSGRAIYVPSAMPRR